jgi:hypothetical protein
MEPLVQIEVLAEKILLKSRSMDRTTFDQALQATYALKKAIEFEYYQDAQKQEGQAEMDVSDLKSVAEKLSVGKKLLEEPWTARFFFQIAEEAILNLYQGEAERPESLSSTDEALACLANWVDNHAGLGTFENREMRIS